MTENTQTKAVFLYPRRLAEYVFAPDHPFKPERISRVYDLCRQKGLFSHPSVRVEEVLEPEEGVLERFHTPQYIEMLRRANGGNNLDAAMLSHGIGTMENPVFAGIYDFSVLSATASLRAARLLAGGTLCAFNPGGGFHHAHADRASGFCYINDVVIALEELKRSGKRVAYLDIDAHHGDGVQEAFYQDPEVLTVSLHESGKTLFPWGGFAGERGKGAGFGYNINVPLEPSTDDEVFLLLFSRIALDALTLFDPDVVVGQFGTDTFSTDPLTHLRMTNNGYIEAVAGLHERFPRILALGGGGYNLDNVVRGWTLLWAELAGLKLEEGYGGAMGGVFLGDASIVDSDLRDMRLFTSGPPKESLMEKAEALISEYEKLVRPVLSK
ncbi:MAG: acetoin utilization protein AcuC [Candidatus Krumholzibacteriota bacterium]|nr:acetoin utilization protein AcuC [Candidatus Krumholzibacteriota bacterium]